MAPEQRPDEEPISLTREDRRRLYQLLEGDILTRLRRIEFALVALTIAVGAPKLGGPSVGEVVGGLLRIFG